MFKPADYVRLGLAIHSPTYYSLTDEESSNMTTNLDDNTINVSSASFTDGGIGSTSYHRQYALEIYCQWFLCHQGNKRCGAGKKDL